MTRRVFLEARFGRASWGNKKQLNFEPRVTVGLVTLKDIKAFLHGLIANVADVAPGTTIHAGT